jgi:DNA-binding NarL/FixJ family response regulator
MPPARRQDPPPSDPVAAIQFWEKQVQKASTERQRAVDRARDKGVTWQQIADALGLKHRQTAETRFSEAGQKRNAANTQTQNERNQSLRNAAAKKKKS